MASEIGFDFPLIDDTQYDRFSRFLELPQETISKIGTDAIYEILDAFTPTFEFGKSVDYVNVDDLLKDLIIEIHSTESLKVINVLCNVSIDELYTHYHQIQDEITMVYNFAHRINTEPAWNEYQRYRSLYNEWCYKCEEKLKELREQITYPKKVLTIELNPQGNKLILL